MLIYIIVFLAISLLRDIIFGIIKICKEYVESLNSLGTISYAIGMFFVFSFKALALVFAILLL
jgi:hypothetical protein